MKKRTRKRISIIAVLVMAMSMLSGILPQGLLKALADTQAPTVPANPGSIWRTSDSVHLVWTPSTDDTGVAAYEIYDSSALIGSTPNGSPHFWAAGLAEGISHTFTIKARDAAGNLSAASQPYTLVAGALDRAGWNVSASLKSSDAKLAIDHLSSTRWTTGTAQNTGMWFQIDTGPAVKTYSKLVLEGGGDFIRKYSITVSRDGASWGEPIASGTGTSATVTAEFPPQTARYIRINANAWNGNYWSIYDMNLFGETATDSVSPGAPQDLQAAAVYDNEVQLAWSPSADESGIYGYDVYAGGVWRGFTTTPTAKVTGLGAATSYDFTVVALDSAGNASAASQVVSAVTASALNRTLWSAKASLNDAAAKLGVDDSSSTRWTSGTAQAAGMWYQVDTGPGEKAYNKLVLDGGGDFPRKYEVRVSQDGTVWSEPVATGTGTASRVTITFPEQTAKYVRIILTGGAGVYWSVYDMNLYGTAVPDEEPPAQPGGLAASNVLDTQLDLSWSPSSDNIAVMGYNLYSGSELVTFTTSTSFQLTGLSPGTAYTFRVEAKDLAGNVSAQSDPLQVVTRELIAVPIIARYEMEPDAQNGLLLADSSGLGLSGAITASASFTAGREGGGKALSLTGPDQAKVANTGLLDKISNEMTISAWVKPQDLNGFQPIATKRDANWKGTTFYLGLEGNKLRYGYDYGEKWNVWTYTSPDIQAGQWFHVAVAFKEGSGVKFYINGVLVGTVSGAAAFPGALPNDVDMLIGTEWHYDSGLKAMVKYGFRGLMDSLRIYGSALTYDQIQADKNGAISTRPAVEGDFAVPAKYATFRLERFDMPAGLFSSASANSKTRQLAARVDGADGVDWPDMTLTIPQAEGPAKVVHPFAAGAEFKTEIRLQQSPDNMPTFQQAYDNVLSPGNHWVRGLYWRWGQTNMYTTDRTARSWAWDYSLWTFPVKIESAESGAVKQVILKSDGEEIYNSGSKVYNSLTLLLPQNESGKPYELWVDGRGPVFFDAGLKEIEPGNPKDEPMDINMALPGSGPAIAVKSVNTPETFPNQAKWNEDTAALSAAKPAAPSYTPAGDTLESRVGIEVPRSPVGVNFIYLPHGMSSGGFFHSEHPAIAAGYQSIGTAADYAAYVADTGYDRVFEFGSFNANPPESNNHDKVAKELADRGVQFGFIPMTDLNDFDLRSQNLPFYTSYLPDHHQPLYRLLQLGLQRLGAYPNAAGVSLGADNAGYAQYWDWAPPHPNRPWGRAYEEFRKQDGQPLTTPLAPSLEGSYTPKTHEQFAETTGEFIDYIARYNETFKNYGYFAKAVEAVQPGLTMTTGSFGSSPGVGGRGGWNWATVPGKEMHEEIPVQSAYDWNELNSSKPLHQVALLDRLKSYNPVKPTWALQDDFSLFYGKTDREKTYAMTLTRGIQSIGTNVLPNNKGSLAKPQMIAEQKELYQWIHKYGGTYAMTEPTPSIGILYVNDQALLRAGYAPETAYAQPTEEGLLNSSHEGKVTEALVMTHGAGWPSKVITPEELKRGLPSSIKTILLTGLNTYDDSWHWYDGISAELQSFVDQGGVIIKDAESVSPVPAVASGMNIRAYTIQSNTDQTNILLSRNAANISILRSLMADAPKPAAFSDISTVWAVPARAGDTEYITVLNEQHSTQAGNEQHLVGQTGELAWNTGRPIYDVRLGRKVTQAEAGQADLTTHGFQWYALPPAEVTAPQIVLAPGESGYYEAAAVIANPDPMTGIPLEWTIAKADGTDSAVVYSATGLTAKLPLKLTDEGAYTVTVKELLSGLSASTDLAVTAHPVDAEGAVAIPHPEKLQAFAARTDKPLTIALTAAQNADPVFTAEANRLAAYYTAKGRTATLGLAEPGGVVRSLQEYKTYLPFPQWKTSETDLILLGNSSTNVLILDQARGFLLPEHGEGLAPGHAAVSYTHSPFVGEYDAVNLVANDAAGLSAAVDALLALPEAKPERPQLLTVTSRTTSSIALSWSGHASDFTVERRLNGNTAWETAGTAVSGQTVFTDTGLHPDTLYTYRVRAAGAAGSTLSDEIRVLTLRPEGDWTAPSAPRNLTAAAQRETEIDLVWDESHDDTGVAGYDVYMDDVKVNGTDISGTSYTVAGLNPGIMRTFTVRAKDAAGNISLPGTPLEAATLPGALNRTGWSAAASRNAGAAARAIDGNASTRWYTDAKQAAGQYYQLDMQQMRTFNKIVLDASGSSKDYPRGYAVAVSADGAAWSQPIAAGTGSAVTSVTFPAQTARYIRITLTNANSRDWSIHELTVYHLDTEAPTAPGNLEVTGVTSTTATLVWSPAADNLAVSGYELYAAGVRLNRTAVTAATYTTVTGLAPSTDYSFTVRAKDSSGNISPDSLPVTAKTMDIPLSRDGWTGTAQLNPGDAAKALDGQAGTRWSTVTSQTYGQYYQADLGPALRFNQLVLDTGDSPQDYPRSYQVYVSADGMAWDGPVAEGAGAPVTVAVFPYVTASHVRIVLTGSDSSAKWSIGEMNLYRTDNEPPGIPSRLAAAGITGTSVQLSWQPATDNVQVAGYRIYSGGEPLGVSLIAGTAYTASGLMPATDYLFRVAAVDTAGNSSRLSPPLTVRTKEAYLDRTGWTASASHKPGGARRALDGNPGTRWDTVSNQVYGQYYQIDMQSVHMFNKIVLDASGSPGDYPRGYSVYVSMDGVEWGAPVATGTGSAVTDITFPEASARFIRVVQTGAAARSWSIHEMYVYYTVP